MSRSATIVTLVAGLAVIAVAAVFVLRPTTDGDPATATSTTASTAPDPTAHPTEGGETTTPVDAAYTPVFEDADCEFELLTGPEPRCGFLVVPQNRSDPGGDQVRLHVAIFESEDPEAPDDPIVYLDGGPGGETLEALVFTFAGAWSPLLEHRDLIFFDQRGVGHSTPSLACEETRQYTLDSLDQDLPPDEYVAGELAALEDCHRRLEEAGVDFGAYHSVASAADVADLRTALDIEEWNLLGISYGTRLAANVMRDHPEGVRSVILDSTYSPQVDLITEAPANLARALDTLFTGCETDPDCADAYPDLEERLFALADRLDQEPMEITVRDVLSNERHDALVDGSALLGTVFQGLYSADVIAVLPQLVAELEEGDTTTMTLLATNDLANGAFVSYGMSLAVQCHEEVPFTTRSEVSAAAEAQPRLTELFLAVGNLGPPIFDICDLWGAGTAGPEENEPVASDLPTLVLAGEYDPITPPAWGEEMASLLDDADYVEFPGIGHGASISGDCPRRVLLDFLDDPSAEPDTGCVAELTGPDFAVPGESIIEDVAMVPFEEEIFGVTVSGLAPDGWESVSPGTWARQTTLIDQTTLVQQATPQVAEPDQLIGLLTGQLGLAEAPQATGTEQLGDHTWSRYRGELDGFATEIAIGSDGSSTGIVVLIGSSEERDTLVADVLDPALEAFSTG